MRKVIGLLMLVLAFIMKQMKLALALASLSVSSGVMACASCGCSLNSDWGTQGMSTEPGWSIDFRYDYLNQNQLRSGTGTISPASAAGTNNPYGGGPAEVEKFTKSQTVTSTIDYNNGNSWGVSLVVPYIKRDHATLGTGSSDGYSPGYGAYTSSTSGIGDIRLIARYYGFTEQKNFGVQLGLKLPTGKTNQFASDGITPVDPGLQLGTGTTDLIVGAYYHNNWNENWGYFGQVMYQRALNSSNMAANDNGGTSYRPGDSWNVNAGLRYEAFDWIKPTLQVNSRFVQKDGGDTGDQFATGGTLVYLTPGALIPLTNKVTIYSTVQLPIYQDVNGIQLAPKYIFSVGTRISF